MKILDIGCGAGTLDFYLANKGYEVKGIDISQKAIDACRKTALDIGLKNADFEVVDFPNFSPKGKYDFVILTEVIEHIDNDALAIKKISKLLNKNGLLLLSTPSIEAPLHKIGFTKKFDRRVGHLRRYSTSELRNLIETDRTLEIIEMNRTEGIIRNFLFVSSRAGKIIKLIRSVFSDIVTYFDNLSVIILGESNILVIAKKVS